MVQLRRRNPLPVPGEGRVRVLALRPAAPARAWRAALTLTLSRKRERGSEGSNYKPRFSRLLDVPERNDLRHRQHAFDVGALGGGLHPLAVIELRDEFPGIVLQLAGDRLALLERLGERPFVAQLLLL